MAKGKGSIQGWITKNGVHIPIYGNYTVREGHEPTAKGSKFKGSKKKKVDTSTTMGKTTKQLEDNLKKKGLVLESADKADMAHKDFNDEKVTLYDNDGNVYRGTYNRYQNGDKEIVNIERDRSAEKVQAGQVEGKKERNVLGQEVDFAEVDRTAKEREKDFIVNTPIPEGKAWERAESKRKAMEAADEADAYDRQHKEGKYADRDWNKDVEDSKRYGYSEQTEEGKKPVTKAEEKKVDTLDNTIDRKIKTKEDALKTLEAAHPGDSQNSKQWETYANMQNSLSRKFNLSKDELKSIGQESSTSNSNITDTLAGLSVEGGKERARIDLGKVDSKTISQMKQKIYKAGDKAGVAYGVQVENTTEKTPDGGYKTTGTSISVLRLDKTGVKKVPSTKTPKLVAPTEEMKKAMGIDKDYGTHNLSAAKETMRRYKTESPLYAEDKVRRYAKAAQAEKAKAQSIADAISGVTGIANSGSIQNMSPSGLKSAYAEATGARKTKLANELRKRGYQLTSGRWTKKKS